MAVNCTDEPCGTVAGEGETAMEFSWSTPRGSLVAVTPLKLAPIFVVPNPIPEAKPVPLTVATEVLEEVHVAVLVRSCVDPLLNKPVAAYCSEPQGAGPRRKGIAGRLPVFPVPCRAGRI